MSDVLFPTIWNPTDQPPVTPPSNFTDPGIIYTQLPQVTQSFNRKYTPNNLFQRQLSTPVYNALRNYDATRVAQGKAPFAKEKTAKMATAAEQNRQVTPVPEKNFVESIGSDLTNLVTSIPQLPFQLVKEAQRLSDVPGEIEKINQSNADPLNQLGQYMQLPGVNLLPGTYTASNLLTGNAGELVDHPLFTALDVLPYASKAAKGTKVAKAAVEAEKATALERSALSGVPVPAKVPNPIKAVLTSKLDENGQLIPNLLGRGVQSGVNVGKRTKIGQTMTDMWGQDARLASRIGADVNKSLRKSFSGRDATDPIGQWFGEVQALNTKHPGIDEVDRVNITKAVTNPVDANGNAIAVKDMGFTGPQLAYAQDVADLSARSRILADMGAADELANREWFGSEEVFSLPQARKLDRIDKVVTKYQRTLDTRKSAIERVHKYTDRNQPEFTQFTMPDGTVMQSRNPFYTPDLDIVRDNLTALQRKQPLAKVAMQAWSDRNYRKFRSTVRSLAKRDKYAEVFDGVDPFKLDDNLAELIDAQSTRDQFKGYTDKNLAKLQARSEAAKKNTVPARFGEVADAQFKNKMREVVQRDFVNDPNFQAYLDFVDQGNYSSLLADANIPIKEYNSLRKEVNQTVADLKARGVDPVFLHRVSPDASKATIFPSVLDKRSTPSSLKSRTLDVSPYVPDLQIALSHQGLEFLNRRYTEEFVNRLDQTYGVNLVDLHRKYTPAAMKAREANPLLDVNHYIQSAIKRDGWVKFETDAYMPWAKKTGSVQETLNARMVPGEIKRNMDRLHNPPKIVATLDPIMNVFRTSVLALSPRWLTNNVIGGAMMLLAETADPIRTLKFLNEARQMTGSVFKGRVDQSKVTRGSLHDIKGMPEGPSSISPDDIAKLTRTTSDSDKLRAIYQTSSGRWMRQIWDDTQAQKAAGKVGRFGKRTIQGSYDINSWFDDFYRSLAYLTGEDKALVKGLSKIEAEQAGIATARKIMQNWDEITPIERTILRYVFPFYGFMQHVARYVAKYPIDHPWRTAIMGNFARNELEDMGSGLPERFLDMGFIGEMDDQGNQKAIALGGANPFAAVGDMFTLGGLLGSTNPLISSFAESLGIDPISGTASLYPKMTYDVESGRLVPVQQNYLSTLAGNILPMWNAANTTLFDKAEFQKLSKTNPDAASRMLQSQLGIPIMYRNINRPQEIMKAEGARIEAESKAKAEMLRTGNYEMAEKFPGLNAYLHQIQELQGNGRLAKYQELDQAKAPNPVQVLVAGYTGQANLPPVNFQSQP